MGPLFRQRVYAWLSLVGVPGFVWCGLNHICCGGHTAHPPYPWWHYAIDVGWAGSFVIAALCAWTRLPRYRRGADILAGLTASRLFMGSCGGLLMIFVELPLACVVIVLGLHAAFSRVPSTGDRGVEHVEGLFD